MSCCCWTLSFLTLRWLGCRRLTPGMDSLLLAIVTPASGCPMDTPESWVLSGCCWLKCRCTGLGGEETTVVGYCLTLGKTWGKLLLKWCFCLCLKTLWSAVLVGLLRGEWCCVEGALAAQISVGVGVVWEGMLGMVAEAAIWTKLHINKDKPSVVC